MWDIDPPLPNTFPSPSHTRAEADAMRQQTAAPLQPGGHVLLLLCRIGAGCTWRTGWLQLASVGRD
jgi:hypothetical protein